MTDTQAKPPRWWPGFRRDNPLARGLVGYWPFWEGQAEKAYDVANPFDTGNHGTLTNGPTWVQGPDGWVLDYVSGSSQWITATAPALTYPFTLGASFMPGSDPLADAIVSVGDFTSEDFHSLFAATAQAGDPFVAESYDGSTYANAQLGGLVVDQWHVGMGVFHTQNSRYAWLDGVSSAENTENPVVAMPPPTLGIGRRVSLSFGSYWQGRISVVAIWDRALTTSEIAEFTADPYALIRPPSTITTFAGLGGAVGNNVPQKYMHYARMRAG